MRSASYPSVMILCCAALCAGGCVVTDVGNPPDKPDVRLTVAAELRADDALPITLQRAWLSFARVRFIESEDCSDDAAVDLARPEPLVVDVNGESFNVMEVTQKQDDFCRLGMFFEPLSATEAEELPPGSTGASLVIQGRIPSRDVPILIQLPLDQKLKLDAVNQAFALTPDDSGARRLVMSIDLDGWFDDAALEQASVGAGDTVVVSLTENEAIATRIIEALRQDVTLLSDADGDGAISDAERAAPLARGGLVTP